MQIAELGYEANVIREIAVLRTLSHPGISRMISCFRWRDGVYLVLEYASNGDLHSLIVDSGTLWCGTMWCGVVWYVVVSCGGVRCGVVWCGSLWCRVVGYVVVRRHVGTTWHNAA